jgi:phosphoserine aminotransferase
VIKQSFHIIFFFIFKIDYKLGDFTSTLLSRAVDINKYGVIFASGGKNLGPAGCCMVIVRKNLVKEPRCD